MGFSMKSSTKPVPTHLKWASANPEQLGSKFEIVTILFNADWRTITFFCSEFKLNHKLDDEEEFCTTRDNLYKSLKRGYCIANLLDSSTIDPKEFNCSVEIEPQSPDRGGRKYELGKNRISIESSLKDKK